MIFLRTSIVFIVAAAMAAPAPKSLMTHRWHSIEIAVFMHSEQAQAPGEEELRLGVDDLSFPVRLRVLGGSPGALDWLSPETTHSALNPPWQDPQESGFTVNPDEHVRVPLPDPPEWLGSWDWGEPFKPEDLASLLGLGVQESHLLFAQIESNARARHELLEAPTEISTPTAKELLEAAREAFGKYENGLLDAAFQWSHGGARLQNTLTRLQERGAQVVLHGHFLQVTKHFDRSPPILLQAGIRHADGLLDVEGTVRLATDRYLELELFFCVPGDAAAGNREDAETMLIQERRRVKAGQSHYFDHPGFGVLVFITEPEFPPELLAQLERMDEAVTGEFLR